MYRSGSFHQQEKKIMKTLDFHWTLCDLISLETGVSLKFNYSTTHKNHFCFCFGYILHYTDPRIGVRLKMSRIRTNATKITSYYEVINCGCNGRIRICTNNCGSALGGQKAYRMPDSLRGAKFVVSTILTSSTYQGIARTQSPTIRNYAFELPTFGVIVGVNPTVVQWPGLTLEEPPSWSWLTSTPGKYASILLISWSYPPTFLNHIDHYFQNWSQH